MHLNPIPVLMAIVVHANIGGTMTPVGDPPNIMITTNPYIRSHVIIIISKIYFFYRQQATYFYVITNFSIRV